MGIADADRTGASANAQAANPINKSRFIVIPPVDSHDREQGKKVLRALSVPLQRALSGNLLSSKGKVDRILAKSLNGT